MTTAKDAIATTMDIHRWGSKWACNCGVPLDEDMPYITHRAHVVDELVKVTASQQATTAAELAELPDRTVIRSAAGTIACLNGDSAYFFGFETSVARNLLELPVTILQLGTDVL